MNRNVCYSFISYCAVYDIYGLVHEVRNHCAVERGNDGHYELSRANKYDYPARETCLHVKVAM